jgi:hypothetical protein
MTLGVLSAAGAAATYLWKRPELRREMKDAETGHEALERLRERVMFDGKNMAQRMKEYRAEIKQKRDAAQEVAKKESKRLKQDTMEAKKRMASV